MTLSNLQKFILRQGLGSRQARISKRVILNFYSTEKNPPQPEDRIKIITKSVERLISRGLAKGLGIKTKEKWFIKEVILTPTGKRKARELLGRQQKIPFK